MRLSSNDLATFWNRWSEARWLLRFIGVFSLIGFDGGCAAPRPEAPAAVSPGSPRTDRWASPDGNCAGDARMRLHFYDVAQGLAVLVDLPDGRHVLVDTGDAPNRAGCGDPCKAAHEHLMSALKADLQGGDIDMLWITHQHSDHVGGAIDVVENFNIATYVDNGRDLDKSQIKRVRAAVVARNVKTVVVDPGQTVSHARSHS